MSEDIPLASGIYMITCIVTRKIYIGSACNLRKRRNRHFNELRQNMHRNSYLQNAWNKYGEQCFTFEVLELVLPMSLTAREQYWLNKLSPFDRKGFNIAHAAGSILGYKRTPGQDERLTTAYQELSEQGDEITVASLARSAHARKTKVAAWLRTIEQPRMRKRKRTVSGTDERLETAYQELSEQGKVTVAALAMAAHVRKATAAEWLRNVEQST